MELSQCKALILSESPQKVNACLEQENNNKEMTLSLEIPGTKNIEQKQKGLEGL